MKKQELTRWPENSGKHIRHGIIIALLIVALFPLSFFGLGPMIGFDRQTLFQASNAEFGVLAFLGIMTFAILEFGLIRYTGKSWKQLGWRFDSLAKDTLNGLAVLIALIVAMLSILTLVGVSLAEIWQGITSFSLRQRVLFFFVGIIAAVSEETLYRGYLQTALISKTNLTLGIIIGAFVFAAAHLPTSGSPIGLGIKVLFGIIYGVARGRDRSLFGPALGHFLFWQIMGSM